jgi:hypothetical protein
MFKIIFKFFESFMEGCILLDTPLYTPLLMILLGIMIVMKFNTKKKKSIMLV